MWGEGVELGTRTNCVLFSLEVYWCMWGSLYELECSEKCVIISDFMCFFIHFTFYCIVVYLFSVDLIRDGCTRISRGVGRGT